MENKRQRSSPARAERDNALRHPYFNSNLDPTAVDEDVTARLRLRNVALWWHAAREPDIAANRRPTAYGDPPKDGCAGVDHNIVLDDGVPSPPLEQGTIAVHGEPLGPQRHTLIQANMPADDRSLADDDARTVVNEKAVADLGAWMNIDPRVGMGNLCNDAGEQRCA